MRISDILRSKGSSVVTVSPDHTVLDVVQTLVDHNIGAVVVVEGDRPVGIVSERDILRLTARGPERLGDTSARTVMSKELVTSSLDDDLDRVMHMMTNHRVRHLPILSNGRLVGIVSIGDIVNRVRSDVEETNRHLMSYISGNG